MYNTFVTWFSSALKAGIERFNGEHGLTKVAAYALESSGKRVRPWIVYTLGEAFELGVDLSSAALAVEYFHTASLIADDLPCMDDDDFRRGQLSLHKRFGEAEALLASYGLILMAFEEISRAGEISSFIHADELTLKAIRFAAEKAGFRGATGGQFLDLTMQNTSPERLMAMIDQKTVGLFEVSFALGALFGSGELELFDPAVLAGKHFGRAFQIVDDYTDLMQDGERHSNIVQKIGKDKARLCIDEELTAFRESLEGLRLPQKAFSALEEQLFSHLATAVV